MNKSVYIETLGCAKNRVDSEIMLGTLLDHQFQYAPNPEDAMVIIVNTCGFLTSAVNESIERILSLAEYKQTGACQKLIVAGCMSERFRDSLLKEMPEVDGLIGTSDYTQILSCVNHALEEGERRSYFEKHPSYSPKNQLSNRVLSTNKHYAYLKVAEGCSNMCSFCNIPKLRGYFQSRPIADIKREFQQLLSSGIKEINLISQDSSSYGWDLGKESLLLPLVRELLETGEQDFWLRTFYSYPNRYPLELFHLMKEDARLVPYVDMPFQHFADPVLKKMNRKITGAEIEKLVNYALKQKEDIAFRTTFIVGFPDETEEDFRQLLRFVEKGYFQHIGVFTYSHEDNIVSAKYGDTIPEALKQERRSILLEAQQKISFEKNRSQVGQIQKVLVEGVSNETDLLLQARNQFQGVDVDGVVLINEGEVSAGQFCDVEIVEAHPYDLVARIV
ncbi:MAG: 30S ribosomal protein S12 methylthiotransferase RimO [SAR324 cluster bacterium]|uniref:Ribosomal protein uS12 methylthiotransferase RimO n=1 Tax=SAR324 cluster bacterium TaxID=2024889 RepID=A0A2A4T427_9DELT|nr:MAG: 30S ribosomal protein S12 methylthiotransferase RimO [SAR324 cluster bacterium]